MVQRQHGSFVELSIVSHNGIMQNSRCVRRRLGFAHSPLKASFPKAPRNWLFKGKFTNPFETPAFFCSLIVVRWFAVGFAFGHLPAHLCTLRWSANSKGSPALHPEKVLSARLSLTLAAPGTSFFAALGRQSPNSRANSRSGLIDISLFDFKAYFSGFGAKTRTF